MSSQRDALNKMAMIRKARRRLVRMGIATILVAGVLSGVVILAYRSYNDTWLAARVSTFLSNTLRGRVQIGEIHWPLRIVGDLLFGTPTPIDVKRVAIYDPAGRRVIGATDVRVKIRPWPALSRGHVIIEDVELNNGYCLLAWMPPANETQSLGLVDTFRLRKTTTDDSDTRGLLVQLNRIRMHNTTYRMRVGPTAFYLPGIELNNGFLRVAGNVSQQGIKLSAQFKLKEGTWTQNGLPVPMQNVRAGSVRIDGSTLRVTQFSTKLAGSPAAIECTLTNLFGDGRIMISGHTTAQYAERAIWRLLGLAAEGHDTVISGHVSGPVDEPTAEASIEGIDLTVAPGLTLSQLSGKASVDVANDTVSVSGFSANTLNGSIKSDATLDYGSGEWRADVALKGIDPEPIAPQIAGRLRGNIALSGNINAGQENSARLNLTLNPRSSALAFLGHIGLRGLVNITGNKTLQLRRVVLAVGNNALRANGTLNLASMNTNIHAALDLPDFGELLRHQLGVPFVRSAQTRLLISGTYPRLRVDGDIQAQQLGPSSHHKLKRLQAKVSLRNGTLKLSALRGEGYGGDIRGRATLALFHSKTLRPMRHPRLTADLDIKRLDLAEFGLEKYARGRISGRMHVRGPFDALTGTATVQLPRVVSFGNTYTNVRAALALGGNHVAIDSLQLATDRGGHLALAGKVFYDGQLALHVKPVRFPLKSIPETKTIALSGQLSGAVDVTGNVVDPRLDGALRLDGMKFRDIDLGNNELRFQAQTHAVHISGNLINGAATVDGFALVRPRPSLHMAVDFNRLSLERVVPQLREIDFAKFKGTASGRVKFDLDSEGGLTWLDGRLSLLEAKLSYRPVGWRAKKEVTLTNREDILLTYCDERLRVVTARIATAISKEPNNRSELALGGVFSPKESELSLRGNLPLALTEMFIDRPVEKVQGWARVDASLKGPIDKLYAQGVIELDRASVRLPRFEHLLEIPEARVELARGVARLRECKIRIGNEQTRAWGTVLLDPNRPLHPSTLQLHVAGELNMGLLGLLFPTELSLSRGAIGLRLDLTGPVGDPRISGNVALKQVELVPRGSGRTLALSSGHVAFSNYLVCLGGTIACDRPGEFCAPSSSGCHWKNPIKGTYDEGLISAHGEARFDRNELVDLFIKLDGSSIPQRVPGVYAAEFNTDLTLVGDQTQLALDGEIDIVDGRYTREFEILRNLIVRPSTHEEAPPFWQGNPLLENLALSLRVRSTAPLVVKNKYASNLGLSAALSVDGTLANPQLHGTVRVEDGAFRIPFLRGDYRVDRGMIVFDRKRAPEDAELDIIAKTQFIDRTGTEYQILLTLKGQLDDIRIKLSSQPHLDQGQIVSLLATGRTTEQLRSDFNTSNQQQGIAVSAADAQVRELTGQVFESFLEDPLKRVMGLDLVQLEVGTETVTARVCKNIGTAIEVCGEGETDYSGVFSGQATANYNIHDYLRLMGRLERLSTRIEREQENPSRGRIELKFRLPLPLH